MIVFQVKQKKSKEKNLFGFKLTNCKKIFSKKAFYNCDALEDADFSDSNLKYLDGHFLIYADSLKSLNVDGSIECDCVNNWMKLSGMMLFFIKKNSLLESKMIIL